MNDERWRDTYDAWKTREPDYRWSYHDRSEEYEEHMNEFWDFESMCDPEPRTLDDMEEEEFEGYHEMVGA